MQRWTSIAAGVVMAGALVGIAVKVGRPEAHASASSAKPTPTLASTSTDEPAVAVSGGSTDSVPEAPELEIRLADRWRQIFPGMRLHGGSGRDSVHIPGCRVRSADAPPRPKRWKRPRRVIEEAKKDFAAAVKKGDHGSTTDAGHLPRGVLEPEVEKAVFTLEKGTVIPFPWTHQGLLGGAAK